jgi:hypothetical protein
VLPFTSIQSDERESFLGLGEFDKALERLNEAWHERSSSLVFLKVERSFAPLLLEVEFPARAQ